jgi:hypothetical protein
MKLRTAAPPGGCCGRNDHSRDVCDRRTAGFRAPPVVHLGRAAVSREPADFQPLRCGHVTRYAPGQLSPPSPWDALPELQRGLAANPYYATGYSNLGFLSLRQGQLDQAVACLLHALAVDPHRTDAPDHLVDVLRAFVDEVVQSGFTDGFLSTQPGGKFDDYNRHIRTREIGTLITAIGQRGGEAGGQALASDLLLGVVISHVEKKMGYRSNSACLKFAWDGIGGWCPAAVTAISPHPVAADARGATLLTPRSEVLGVL